MELDLAKIDTSKTPIIGLTEFARDFAEGISIQAVKYAIKHNHVDYVIVSKRASIVLTPKSRAYSPNKNKNRSTMSL